MKANPYFKLACLLAAFAPNSGILRAVPINGACHVSHQTGARVCIEIAVIRERGGFVTIEATLTRSHLTNPLYPKIEIVAKGSLSAKAFSALHYHDVLERLFDEIQEKAWRFALDPTINEDFDTLGDLINWIVGFQEQIDACERRLRGADEPTPATPAKVTVNGVGTIWGKIEVKPTKEPEALPPSSTAKADWRDEWPELKETKALPPSCTAVVPYGYNGHPC